MGGPGAQKGPPQVPIGKRWPSSAPRGDHAACCDYCGVRWRRSELKRDGSGQLYCPDEGTGKDAVTLSLENARGAEESAQRRRRVSGGNQGSFDTEPEETAPPRIQPG